MQAISHPRMTPWVLRLIFVNAAVLLLLDTVFTSDGSFHALAFDPATALSRPWTFFTYLFVHADLLHLLANSLGLWMLGSAVEQRLGGEKFLLYYLYCGVGAAFFALLLSKFALVQPFVGASGAILGLAVALAILWPDAEMLVIPIPIPMKARTFAILLVAFNAIMALPFLRGNSSIAYEAHLGGALFGYLFFRLQSFGPESSTPRRQVQRPVMVQPGAAEAERSRRVPAAAAAPASMPSRSSEVDPVAREMDRVLDKISAEGIQSLTPDERRFLDDIARQKRQQLH
jgi:membrane associated rhomboid family serine protease